MKRAALTAMFRRIDRAFNSGNRYGATGMSQFAVKDIVLREVNRALREQRAESHVCLDCRTVLVPQPVLCEDCVRVRNAAGVSLDSMRRYP